MPPPGMPSVHDRGAAHQDAPDSVGGHLRLHQVRYLLRQHLRDIIRSETRASGSQLSSRPLRHRPRRLRALGWRHRDQGQISVLILGLFGIALVLVIGGIDVTAAQIARTRLLDAADAAALDAADALDEPGAYGNGLGSSVTLSNATVQEAAAGNLATRPRPAGITSWTTTSGTGTTDGQTAVVVLLGVADLPLTGGLLSSLGGSVTITVQARARAPLTPR